MPPHYNPFLLFCQVQNISGLMKISMAILKYYTLRDLRFLQRLALRIQVLWDVMWCCVIGQVFSLYLFFFDCWNLKKLRHCNPPKTSGTTLWYRITFQKTLLKILNSPFSHFSKALDETVQYTFITTFFIWILVQSTALTIASVNFLR